LFGLFIFAFFEEISIFLLTSRSLALVLGDFSGGLKPPQSLQSFFFSFIDGYLKISGSTNWFELSSIGLLLYFSSSNPI
jgi:hypothetical protein